MRLKKRINQVAFNLSRSAYQEHLAWLKEEVQLQIKAGVDPMEFLAEVERKAKLELDGE